MENTDIKNPREGDLYKVFEVGGHIIEIRYGYYSEKERGMVEPLPVFPNFREKQLYSKEGLPLASAIDSACEHYTPIGENPEDCCSDCRCFSGKEIGICRCKERICIQRKCEEYMPK